MPPKTTSAGVSLPKHPSPPAPRSGKPSVSMKSSAKKKSTLRAPSPAGITGAASGVSSPTTKTNAMIGTVMSGAGSIVGGTAKKDAGAAHTLRRSDERVQRMADFGIDCPDDVVWRHWEVGGEYERKIILKNTHKKLQVVKYNLPSMKATFFVEFPKPVSLSSGMGYELVVKFRPTQQEELHDSIDIEVEGRGTFTLDLVALIPYVSIDVPEKIDFNFCPVNETTTIPMPVFNNGTLPLDLEWEVMPPFAITPSVFELKENQRKEMTVSFTPTEATALVTTAVCRTAGQDGRALAIATFSGIGKYPFLSATEGTNLEFNAVLTRRTVTQTITVQNRSHVDATFTLTRADRDIVNPFTFTPTSGVVEKGKEVTFSVQYRPESTGAHYSNEFLLATKGGNVVHITCTGSSYGPSVLLSTKAMDFGDVDIDAMSATAKGELSALVNGGGGKGGAKSGDATAKDNVSSTGRAVPAKAVTLKNKSNIDVPFSFIGCEPGNAFSFSPPQGVLPPRGQVNVTVRFVPTQPVNYLRRVHVLLRHGDQALVLDVFGTGFSTKGRPPPFNIRHVKAYYNRIAGGLGRAAPEELDRLLQAEEDNIPPADEDEAAARQVLLTALSDANAATVGQKTATESAAALKLAARAAATSNRTSEPVSPTNNNTTLLPGASLTTGLGADGKNTAGAVPDGTMTIGGVTQLSATAKKMVRLEPLESLLPGDGGHLDGIGGGKGVGSVAKNIAALDQPYSLTPASLRFISHSNSNTSSNIGSDGGHASQLVTIYNHTSAKAAAVWRVPAVAEPQGTPGKPGTGFSDAGALRTALFAAAGAVQGSPGQLGGDLVHPDTEGPWVVTPPAADIPPMASQTFRIRRGRGAESLVGTFGHTLECYVAPKSMRSFRLANDDTLSPPQCLLLQCQRVVPASEHGVMPQPGVPSHIAFPACHSNSSALQVIPVSNPHDTVAAFDVSIVGQAFRAAMNSNGAGVGGHMKGRPQISAGLGAVPVSRDDDGVLTARTGASDAAPQPMPIADFEEHDEDDDILDQAFSCYPISGTIPPKGIVLVIFRFAPDRLGRYNATAVVSLNEAAEGRRVFLRGESFVPELSLAQNGVLAFRPTAVGGEQVRSYGITNPSRIPIAYNVTIPKSLAPYVRISPLRGIVHGCATLQLNATFAPTNARRYEGTIEVEARAANPPSSVSADSQVTETHRCRMIGNGVLGVVAVEPLDLDVGTVLVGQAISHTITVFNSSLCDVTYKVNAIAVEAEGQALPDSTDLVDDIDGDVNAAAAIAHHNQSQIQIQNQNQSQNQNQGNMMVPSGSILKSPSNGPAAPTGKMEVTMVSDCSVGLGLDESVMAGADTAAASNSFPKPPPIAFVNGAGVLRGRSHTSVDLSLSLPKRGQYKWLVYVISHGSKDAVEEAEPTLADVRRLPHCALTLRGGYPTLQFTDARSVFQSKAVLWRQLSLASINEHLTAPVDDNKDTETKTFSFEGAAALLDPFVFDLGVDSYRTAPARVLVRLDNTGHCPVGLRFLFPNESEIPKEVWHQDPLSGVNGERIAEIIDRKLFEISPREATVPAKGSVVIEIKYQHTIVGEHRVPLLMRLESGRRVLLDMRGKTLKDNARCLQFHHSRKHELFPVAIGDQEPPLQYLELRNVSQHAAMYTVDPTAIQQSREANYDFPVFQCLNPQGIIPPLSTVLLSWYFRPLEAVEYELKIPIHVEGIDDEFDQHQTQNGIDGPGSGGAVVAFGGDQQHNRESSSQFPAKAARSVSISGAPLFIGGADGLDDNAAVANGPGETTDGRETYEITLMSRGFHPNKLAISKWRDMYHADHLKMPAVPTLKHTKMLPVCLSMDVLDFGAVPQHTLHRRLMTIENNHTTDTFAFEWHSVLQYGDQLLDIEPPHGRVGPGESIAMRVTMYTGSTSHIIENGIHCHVLNESLRNRRAATRAEREREAALALDEPSELVGGHGVGEIVAFSASGASTRNDRRSVAAAVLSHVSSSTNMTNGGGAVGGPRSAVAASGNAGTVGNGMTTNGNGKSTKAVRAPDGTVGGRTRVTDIPAKYQSTTRLRQAIQQLSDATVAEELDENADELVEQDIFPTVLETLVKAHILPLEVHDQVFGDAATAMNYFPTFRGYSTPVPHLEAEGLFKSATESEAQLVHDILEGAIRAAVYHPSVADAYRDIAEDPVPYFSQMVKSGVLIDGLPEDQNKEHKSESDQAADGEKKNAKKLPPHPLDSSDDEEENIAGPSTSNDVDKGTRAGEESEARRSTTGSPTSPTDGLIAQVSRGSVTSGGDFAAGSHGSAAPNGGGATARAKKSSVSAAGCTSLSTSGGGPSAAEIAAAAAAQRREERAKERAIEKEEQRVKAKDDRLFSKADGDVQCLVEEVLEDTLFSLICGAMAGVVAVGEPLASTGKDVTIVGA